MTAEFKAMPASGDDVLLPVAAGYSYAPSNDLIPALDGLRAVSILLVVFSHLGLGRYIPGLFGVTIFFFISGFLITRQLLAEQARPDGIHFGKFYMRRLLRLYPALLVAILAGAVILAFLIGLPTVRDTVAAVFYLSNYWELAGGFQSGLTGIPHPYGIFWSLAVEEHYYLVYPAVVALLGARRTRLAAILVVAIIVVTLWRTYIAAHCTDAAARCLAGGDEMRVLHATDTRIDSILYGAVLASLLGGHYAARLLRTLRSDWALVAGSACVAASLVIRDPLFRDSLRFSVQGVGLFLAVGNILFSERITWPRQILSTPPFRAVGRWSYSLYLWHWLVLIVALSLLPAALRQPAHQGGLPLLRWAAFAIPVFVLSLIAAAGSYVLIERPMLTFRKRFRTHS